jgi:hypothetical protein
MAEQKLCSDSLNFEWHYLSETESNQGRNGFDLEKLLENLGVESLQASSKQPWTSNLYHIHG